jgi:uncharacterized protein YbbK (DUF523 family)
MNTTLKELSHSKPILVSACLLGINCTYRGDSNLHPAVMPLLSRFTIIPICPEQLGGLCTPRTAAEIQSEKVIMKDGTDVTLHFARGAAETLRLAELYGCKLAILKQRSPSCGNGTIYDGSHQGRQIRGDGITTRRLREAGLAILSEEDLDTIKAGLK